MKHYTPPLIVSGCLAILATICRAEAPQPPSAPAVPDVLKTGSTDTLAFAVHAKGFQIYECQPKKEDPTQYEWALKAPEADLFDEHEKKIGRHYGGPTWESTVDGSKIMGEVKGKAPSPDAGAIPWLLLNVKAHEGNGVFSQVSRVQRLETVGGKAPAEACDPSSAGKEVRVPYTAVYYFYLSKP